MTPSRWQRNFLTLRHQLTVTPLRPTREFSCARARQGVPVNARLRPGFLIRPVDLQPAGRGQILDEDTVDLDDRRGMAAQKATGMRRQLAAVEADHAALRARQEELEHFLLAAPATDWGEAVAKARYLLTLFAQTPAAEDPRRVRLIADVLADFERLLAEPPARRG
jgi:hypothetical protein